MNEFEIQEVPAEVKEIPAIPEVPNKTSDFETLKAAWKEYIQSIKDFAESVKGTSDLNKEYIEAREFGVKEGVEVAKECFTEEVIERWGKMSVEERNEILQKYAAGIGEALNIDYKGIVWEPLPNERLGYNNGDGYLRLNVGMLAYPGSLMILVDVIAHEARHQMQTEAIMHPDKSPFDAATITEWAIAQAAYDSNRKTPTAEDPWGYKYNPKELDSRFYAESIVRELTKDLIVED